MNTSTQKTAVSEYLDAISRGLRRVDAASRDEILREIRSHLQDRIAQLTEQGSPHPMEEAIRAMGDPREVSAQFVTETRLKRASLSFAPWVLLRAAWRLAFMGVKGLIAFIVGFTGYAISIALFAAALAKGIWPEKIGFWVGEGYAMWGYRAPMLPPGEELAGDSFAWISVIVGFAVGALTTVFLQRLMKRRPMRPAVF